jgi:nitrite reductase/ring-hydroxylating ferredoxin subunit
MSWILRWVASDTRSPAVYIVVNDVRCLRLLIGERKVTCPLHGATFDITNGNALGPPAPGGVIGYKVQVEGNEIYIEAP